jgi:hypothetical protein
MCLRWPARRWAVVLAFALAASVVSCLVGRCWPDVDGRRQLPSLPSALPSNPTHAQPRPD